jgi:hypothetical protein
MEMLGTGVGENGIFEFRLTREHLARAIRVAVPLEAEDLVDSRSAEVEVDEQGAFPLLSGGESEVAGDQGFALTGQGAAEEGDTAFFFIA